MTNKEEINKLLIKENELYHEQQKYSDKLSSVKIEIQKIKTKKELELGYLHNFV